MEIAEHTLEETTAIHRFLEYALKQDESAFFDIVSSLLKIYHGENCNGAFASFAKDFYSYLKEYETVIIIEHE